MKTLIQTLEACCPAVGDDPLTPGDAERLASALRAVADPARLRLLGLIAAAPSGEACVCHLTGPLGLSQPTVSHHLRVLLDAGFLTKRKGGTWAFYRVVPEALETLRAALDPGRVPRDRYAIASE